MKTSALAVLALVAVLPVGAAAQDLAADVAAAGSATVRFTYRTRPDVEICDEDIRIGDDHVGWRGSGWRHATHCRRGPAEVELDVREGRVRGVEVVRSRASATRGAVDLGEVPAPDAARYLLGLARIAPDRAGEHAVFAAVLADVTGLWRDLLGLARDRSVPRKARKSALFWIGQQAADSATRGLREVASDDDEAQDVRNAAIFSLSQRDASESVPALMDLASTAQNAETRRTAMFWLAQSDDPRVPGFFESILLGK